MPVPDSYSRRYGREETTYTSSYSTTRGTRSSYLSSYSAAKQSTSLPPRPPSLYGSDTYRKYGDTSTSVTSRFLTSSGASSRIRDYGTGTSSTTGAGGYRTSVSPVRATSALRSSITDRLKAMEIDGKDDDMPVRSYTSRYSTLRNREPVSSIARGYTSSTYARDRSNSREYGTSPLSGSSSNLSNSQRERDPSLTRSSTENLKKRGSPSPTSTVTSSRKDSSEAVVANGLSSSEDSDAFSSSPQQSGNFRSRGHERAGLTGLRNIGNTCFMNTVIQCLSNTKPLLEYLIRDGYGSDLNTTTSAMKGCLIRAFSEVIQELWREQRVVDTSAFKDQIQKFAPRFMGYSQQDAQEFLRYLLEGMHEDVNRVTSKPTPILTDIEDSLSDSQKATEAWKRYLRYENSRIVDIFVGQLRSTLKCTVCGNCSVTFDPFWDLSLPIPARTASTRLAQCFELFTKEEVLDGDEKPTCSKCQCRRKCTKSFSIQKFPRILVIHLKRFSPMERYRGKLSTLVDYPLNGLDLSPYAANRGGQAVTYNLYGVANHSGSTYSGHYIAYCKHPYSGEWHSYNDSRVSPISSHQVISTEGYVLFYEQST